MVFLGFGKYARADRIYALEPLVGERVHEVVGRRPVGADQLCQLPRRHGAPLSGERAQHLRGALHALKERAVGCAALSRQASPSAPW